MKNIYERLREKLDDMATGFPATESGVELRLLKRLFTEQEAELFLVVSPMLQTPEDVAEKNGLDPDETAERMEEMAHKGLLFRVKKNDLIRYAAPPYVVGIFEFQLNRLDRELVNDMEEYFETAFGRTIQSYKTPVLRTIPINRELSVKWPVAPYEDALQIIDNQKSIAVAPCICRKLGEHSHRDCDKPIEVCLAFGSHADYYVQNGMGRHITAEEAKEIIKRNDEAGLVIQPFNSQRVGGMCSCCGDCCGALRSLKKQPIPADAVQSNYYAQVNDDECIGCETCVERCQMEAVDMVDDTAAVNLDRCIGCGLCVTTCPTEAMTVVKKPEEDQYLPPESGGEVYVRIAMERGINPLEKQY